MNRAALFVRRNSFAIFVVLAYLLSWWVALMPGGGLLPHGPLLAAVIVVGISEGKAGLKIWWSRTWRSRTAWQWYALAVAIPVVLTFIVAGLYLLLGAALPAQLHWEVLLQVLPIMLLLSGMWEEPGWTGFALPHLYERFGASPTGTLMAALITGVVRTGWHIPLMLSGAIEWPDALATMAFQLVLTWLFNSSGSIVPVVMLAHLTNNIVSGELLGAWFTDADAVNLTWLRVGVWVALALVLLIVTKLDLGRKPEGELGIQSVKVAPTVP